MKKYSLKLNIYIDLLDYYYHLYKPVSDGEESVTKYKDFIYSIRTLVKCGLIGDCGMKYIIGSEYCQRSINKTRDTLPQDIVDQLDEESIKVLNEPPHMPYYAGIWIRS